MWQPEYPDPTICKTKHYIGDLWECSARRAECPYGMKYGADYYCLHKDCSQFGIERKERRKQGIPYLALDET